MFELVVECDGERTRKTRELFISLPYPVAGVEELLCWPRDFETIEIRS